MRQIAHKREILTIESTRGQGQQQGNGTHQGHHRHPQIMRCTHQRTAWVGNGGHPGFTEQAHVVTGQHWGEQGARVKLAAVVTFFVHRVRQLLDVELLQWFRQRHQCVNALEVSAGAFGVFTHPMTELGGGHQSPLGQDVLQRR